MKWIARALFVLVLAGLPLSVSAQSSCRPPTLPLPGAPVSPTFPPSQILVDEIGHQIAPIPFLVFLGDVVLVDGDAALAAKQECDYYTLGQIDPSTWSDVLHIDNNAAGGLATLYSDCDANNTNDPCLPPYEIPFPTVYTSPTQLVNPVFIAESATGPTVYQPLPGVAIAYVIDSDPIETTHPGPGTPSDCRHFIFKLSENCQGTKIVDGLPDELITCVTVDPVTQCPAYLLDGNTAFASGWVRIHEGDPSAPVSDLLHFFGNHFVSFCSDPPEGPNDPPEPADVGIPPIPAGDVDPIVDIVEDAFPTLYSAGIAPCSVDYLIFSDPPEPVPAQKSTWGRLKGFYR